MSAGTVANDEFVAPAYGRRSLADVVPAIAHALNLGGLATPTELELPDASAYVVFLVDGLGANVLRRYAHAAPYLSSLLTEPGTAGVPSTTATSLTSFGTGLAPGSHGLVGYTSRIPGTDRLLNALQWSKDVDPHEWQPNRTTFQSLREAGTPVAVINKREYAGSGLTEAAHRGAEFIGADKVGERIAAASIASAERGSITYLYDGDLDWTGHRHGVASSPWLQQLSIIDAEAEQLRESLPPSVKLLIVADHGMIDCGPEDRTDIDALPGLRDGVALLGGEARFRHLYCHSGAVDDVVATWRETLGEKADVLTREEAITAGWFGPVVPQVLPRLGDIVVASRGTYAVMSSVSFPYETTLVGLHGSLTADEMLIPILLD